MKNLDALREFLRFIYDGFGFSDDYGVRYFSRYKSELLKYDPKDVISLQMKIYSHDYVLGFLMGGSVCVGKILLTRLGGFDASSVSQAGSVAEY